jgi:methionine-rich copper-binding protein CopC
MKFVTARVLGLVAVLTSALSLTVPAQAHAFLDHAAPAVGSRVHGAPLEVRLWFSQELEPAFSAIRVVNETGAQVDKRDKAVDPGDRTQLRVSLPPLPSGTYKVIWRALSSDTHVTEGDFVFEVAP